MAAGCFAFQSEAFKELTSSPAKITSIANGEGWFRGYFYRRDAFDEVANTLLTRRSQWRTNASNKEFILKRTHSREWSFASYTRREFLRVFPFLVGILIKMRHRRCVTKILSDACFSAERAHCRKLRKFSAYARDFIKNSPPQIPPNCT